MKIKNFDIREFNIIEDSKNYYVFRPLIDKYAEAEDEMADDDGIIRLITDRNAYDNNLQEEPKEENTKAKDLPSIWDYIKLIYEKEETENQLHIDYGEGYCNIENQKYIVVRIPKSMKITAKLVEKQNVIKEVEPIEIEETIQVLEEASETQEKLELISLYDETDFAKVEEFESAKESEIIDEYDENGFDEEGYDREGYNQLGYDKEGYDRLGFNQAGYNKENFDRLGYNKEGYNENGYDRTGFNKEGYDKEGFDKTGYNKEGFDRIGYDKSGYNADGFNKAGIDKEGYNKEGYDSTGFDRNGYNAQGYNKNGIDKRGFDRNGYFYQKLENGTYANTKLKYNKYGFRADGTHSVTKTEVDLRNFDIDGKCKTNADNNYDENGFKQDGTYRETGEKYHEGYNAFGVDKEGRTKTGELHEDIAFAQDYIKSVMQGKTKEFINSKFTDSTISEQEIIKEIDLKIYRASEMYPLLRNKIAINMMSVKRAITKTAKDKEKLNNENTTNKAELEKLQGEMDTLNETMSELELNTSEVENDKIKTII